MTGWQMLLFKEVLRFWRVAAQTITGPILTALLYLLVFGQALEYLFWGARALTLILARFS